MPFRMSASDRNNARQAGQLWAAGLGCLLAGGLPLRQDAPRRSAALERSGRGGRYPQRRRECVGAGLWLRFSGRGLDRQGNGHW